jgi:hypothetical protein
MLMLPLLEPTLSDKGKVIGGEGSNFGVALAEGSGLDTVIRTGWGSILGSESE